MNDTLEAPAVTAPKTKPAAIPARLHHNAYVVADQARTRAFYEDVLGMPLVQFWIENANMDGQHWLFSHAFYGLEDGSALAFFCMADAVAHEKFKSPATEVFNHIALLVSEATYDTMLARLQASGYQNYSIDHGYCKSLYVMDPDGLRVEFAVDSPEIDAIVEKQARTAHETFQRWIDGDRSSNNEYRH